ncbi:MAG TPA: class I SAM-dependent methyltransferase [Allosphingosinicella sp.]
MHERIIGLYEENAAAWDRQRGRQLIESAWLERFSEMLPHGGTILDIGCGMGEPMAAWLIERGFSVTGLDSSPSLIAMCRRRFPEQEWIVGDMRRTALGRRFDGLIAWHSFFHLPQGEQRATFPRFSAHAAAGAALMFTSGPCAGETLGEWQGEPLYHASLDAAEYQALLAENGFSVRQHAAKDPDCGDATIWLAQAA